MIVGIDLGTTNSLVGVMDAGFPILFADESGARLTPSIVHFPPEGGPIVGTAARRMLAVAPESTVYSVKRFIGRRWEDLEPEAHDLGYQVVGHPGSPAAIRCAGKDHLPEEISACVLRKLKADVERSLGEAVNRAVITVPAYFNDAQRNATRRAGELAGWQVERIINEPTAAALAYGLDKLAEHARVAVYDFGGGTFDLSILEIREGVFQVLSTNGNTRLGGDDIDRAILNWMLEQIPEKLRARISLDLQALSRCREAAETAKRRLSEVDVTPIELPFLAEDFHFSVQLERSTLEQLALPIIEETRKHCLRAVEDAGISLESLQEVILVGGSTRMPLVRKKVGGWFQREPNLSQNPDEAVAIGATIQAGILSGAVRDVVLLDVTPLSLGIETFGGLMNVIIPRNSTIPVKAGELFTNAVAGQREMMIRILQGEREMAKDNWELGRVDIEFVPAPRGKARVGVQFEIDADGILHVLARDTATGNEKIIEIQSAIDVTDSKVEQMISESVEFAFEDINERRFTEAMIKAKELIPAVEQALEALKQELESGEVERIGELLRILEKEIYDKNTSGIKKAMAELDAATAPLAALLVDRAMEEALARRGASFPKLTS